LIYPTPEEDAQLVAAAMSDPDNLPLTDEEWEAVKPLARIGWPPVSKPLIQDTRPVPEPAH